MSRNDGDSASSFDFRHFAPTIGLKSGGVELRHHKSMKENYPSFDAILTFEDAVCRVKSTSASSFVNFAGSTGMLESHVETANPRCKHDTPSAYDNVHSDTTPDGVYGGSTPNMLGVGERVAEPPLPSKSPNAMGVCTSPPAGWCDATVVRKKSCI